MEGLGNAFKRCNRVDLHRSRMCLGLDGVALWRQLRAVPTDDAALPRGARLLANALSELKRCTEWRLELVFLRRTDNAALLHIHLSLTPLDS